MKLKSTQTRFCYIIGHWWTESPLTFSFCLGHSNSKISVIIPNSVPASKFCVPTNCSMVPDATVLHSPYCKINGNFLQRKRGPLITAKKGVQIQESKYLTLSVRYKNSPAFTKKYQFLVNPLPQNFKFSLKIIITTRQLPF